jgi:putative ABC transport system permease protein
MLLNHLKMLLRSLRTRPAHTVLNVTGLAIGLATCLLVARYVQHEWSFDRFHADADRLYRLNKVVTPQEGGVERHAITSGPMGPTLVDDFPEIDATVRVLPWFSEVLMTHDDVSQPVEHVAIADANFFEVFDFRIVRGEEESVLTAPRSIVLTEQTARRFFGDDDPIGQTVTALGGLDYTVTGLAADPPTTSHLPFDALISWASTVPGNGALDYGWLQNWLPQAIYTYVRLQPDVDAAALDEKLPAFMDRHFPERADQYHLYLQPFTDIYLGSTDLLHTRSLRLGDRRQVYLFGAIGLLVLLIACINFVNLATARAAQRAQEVGVRKVLGAAPSQLRRQFLGEALLLTGGAALVAVLLAEATLPAFNALAGTSLNLHLLANGPLLAGLVGLTLLAGLASGLYPALVLSRYRPSRVLRGGGVDSRGSRLPRRILVTTQFAISAALIVGTVVVYQQMQFVLDKDLGFQKEQIVVLPIGKTDISDQGAAFKQTLLQHPEIIHAAGSNSVPGATTKSFTIHPEGASKAETWVTPTVRVDDFDLLATYGLQMTAGRYFTPGFATDSARAVVINQTLAGTLGWDDPVGKRLTISGEVEDATVIGVMEDFHLTSLRQAIDPLVLYVAPRWDFLSVRLTGDDIPATLDFLRQTWEQFETAYPFEYTFLDDAYARLYASEQRLTRTLTALSALAILVACLGLFGLITFTVERRTKEIGIRKVLGASISSIMVLLSKEFARLVLVAIVLAAPVAALVAQSWLDGFAYHIDLGTSLPLALGLAGALILTIALLTVSTQALRAALADPVQSLRYE